MLFAAKYIMLVIYRKLLAFAATFINKTASLLDFLKTSISKMRKMPLILLIEVAESQKNKLVSLKSSLLGRITKPKAWCILT